MLVNKVIRVCGKLMRPYWNKTQSKSLGRALTTGKCSCFSNISQSTRRGTQDDFGPLAPFLCTAFRDVSL